MIGLQCESINRTEWTAVVSQFQDSSLLQTWEYGEATRETGLWGVERMIFRDGKRVIGAAQALTRTVPFIGGGLAWVNRGPLWRGPDDSNPTILSEIMKAMRRHWVDHRGLYLRVAPPLRQDNPRHQLFGLGGYTPTQEGRGWISARLDLSQSLETIRAKLDKRWRNSLSNAERRGLELEIDPKTSFDKTLRQFGNLLRESAYMTTVTPKFLRCLRTCSSTNVELHTLSAEQEGRFMGGIVIVRYGDVAEYLVGVIDEAGRSANTGQFLIWQAVCRMKETGCVWFDLGGLDPEVTTSGVLRIKAGLNAEPYQYVGEFEAWRASLSNGIVRWWVRQARKKFA